MWSSREEENGRGEPSSFATPDLDSFCGLVHSDVQWLAARPDLTPLSTWIDFAPLCEGASLVQLRVVSPCARILARPLIHVAVTQPLSRPARQGASVASTPRWIIA